MAILGDERAGAGYDVFISHKTEYRPWVEWLAHALESAGRSVFLDIWNLVPGESWVAGLHRGLQLCRAAILVATPEVVNSGWVREEYNSLQRRRQAGADFRLIPLVFGPLPNLPFLENLQAIDAREPGQYRRWLHLLLCGLDGREPGSDIQVPADIPSPPPLRPAFATDVVPGEAQFVTSVIRRLATPSCPPLMVTSRGRRFQGPVIEALAADAANLHGPKALLRVTPALAEGAATEACFSDLARQCGLGTDTTDADAFRAAMERRIDDQGPVILMVIGIENASSACRREMCRAFRALTEGRHSASFRLLLVGGYRLVEQKYAAGDQSFLTSAVVEQWPQPMPADVLAWRDTRFPGAKFDADAAVDLLATAGGHAGVVRHCLERCEQEGGTNWVDWCVTCPELWETWHALAREDAPRLKAALEREQFGLAVPWPADPTARRLYWADLLAADGLQMRWRSELVRRVGREVLA